MSRLFLVALAIPVVWIGIMLLLKGYAAYLRRSTLKAARQALAQEKILRITDNASFLGADFPGPNLPPRTSGVLAVTDRSVYFLPWFPRKSVTIPHAWVRSVRTEKSFGSLSFAIPVLVIGVRDVKDPEGLVGWLVKEPWEWREEIGKLVGRGRP